MRAGALQLKDGDAYTARRTYKRAFYHADFDEMQTWDMQDHHKAIIDNVQLPIILNLAQVICLLPSAISLCRCRRQ